MERKSSRILNSGTSLTSIDLKDESFSLEEDKSDIHKNISWWHGEALEPRIHLFQKMVFMYNLINERFAYQTCSISSLLHEALIPLQDKARQQNISLRVYCDRRIKIRTSPELIRFLMVQLVNNSIAFSKPDQPHAYIELDCSVTDDQLSLVVEDNGMGIPANILPFIFKPENAGTIFENNKGTGLFLVKMALDLLEGEIQAESLEGCYTKMKVTLKLGN